MLFNYLAAANISVDVILQSIGRDNTKDISFTVAAADLDEAYNVINSNMSSLGAKEIKCRKDISKVSIVGAGMVSHPGVAVKMFEALYDAHINISMISTSEIKISVLIEESEAERAVRAIHDKFFN